MTTNINDNAKAIDGSFIVKAIVETYKQTVLKNIRDNIEKASDEENKKYAEDCTNSLTNLKMGMDSL